jgi:hypothetical protein
VPARTSPEAQALSDRVAVGGPACARNALELTVDIATPCDDEIDPTRHADAVTIASSTVHRRENAVACSVAGSIPRERVPDIAAARWPEGSYRLDLNILAHRRLLRLSNPAEDLDECLSSRRSRADPRVASAAERS